MRGQIARAPFRNGFGNRGIGLRIRTFRNCFGCRGGIWPWYGPYYDPWWWWDSDSSSYDQDQPVDDQQAYEMNEQNLEDQQAMDAPYAPSRYAGPRNEQISAESPALSTVLVFRDQHKQEVQNYAIVGQTLFSFAPQRTQRIPLSDLDLTATQKANEDRGVDFRVPVPNEGQ